MSINWEASGYKWTAHKDSIHGCSQDTEEVYECITAPLPESDSDRVDLAAALLGDRYEISERLADWERELLDQQTRIDPADVKVGDVVEVEANDGSWLVRGEVGFSDQDFMIALPFIDPGVWPDLTDATVRLVRRAEPEPDPAEVEALEMVLEQAEMATSVSDGWHKWARELVRRGVTVRKET